MAADKQVSPGTVGDDHYKQTFDKPLSLKEQESKAAEDTSSGNGSLQHKEAAGTKKWKTNVRPGQQTGRMKARLRGGLRHKSAFAFIVILFIGGIWYSSIFAPNILLVNIKDLFTNDLADATTALSKYSIKMIDAKLGKADCGEEDSIKCKLTTMSRNQVLTFKKNGFKVNGSKVTEDNLDDNNPGNDKPESRWKVSSLEFPNGGGTASSGDSFARIASSSDNMQHTANNAWNPRSSFFMDARYKQRIKTQFDLKKTAQVSGRSEKEVDEAFDEAMSGADEAIDANGRGAFSLATLASNTGKDGLKKTADTIAAMPNSYVNVQCGVFTHNKVVYNSMQKAKEVSLARFAMIYLIAADQIKAGQSEEVTSNVLSSKLAWSTGGGYTGKNATDAAMYRHIVLREPVKSSDNGMKYYAQTFEAPGVLFAVTLNTMMTAATTKSIARVSSGSLAPPPVDIASNARDYCLEGQKTTNKSASKPTDCPALTMAAGAAPLLAPLAAALTPIAAASDRTCPMPPKGTWLMAPTAKATSKAVLPFVAGLFNGVVGPWAERAARDFNHNTKGTAASDALFAGTGVILGDMAMSRGMRPASKESLQTYLSHKSEDARQYEQLAKNDARRNPFDIYNEYSFFGSLARSLSVSQQPHGLAVIDNVLKLLPASIAHITPTTHAIYNLQPAELETSRLQCTDAEYLKIGINADMGCNVRYSMGDWELNASISNVLNYMLKSHPNETRKQVTELENRLKDTDAENDTADVARQLKEVKEASDKPFIDEKTGEATKNSEYEKYLTYCVDREDPWGRSAMVVRREELDEEEKENRRGSKDADGNQITEEHTGSEYEKKAVASYMAVTEGASADQDWYTGKKCLEETEMLRNFRAYTMACSVDGSFAGALDCTEKDNAGAYTDAFYTGNDIQYFSWN